MPATEPRFDITPFASLSCVGSALRGNACVGNIRLVRGFRLRPDCLIRQQNVTFPQADGLILAGVDINWLASFLTLSAKTCRWVAIQYPQYTPTSGCVRRHNAPRVAVVVRSCADGPGVGAVVSWDEDRQECWLVQKPTPPSDPPIQYAYAIRDGYYLSHFHIMDPRGELDCRQLGGVQLPNLPIDGGLVVAGQGPIWLYAALACRAAEEGWPWFAAFNVNTPGLRGVVVWTSANVPVIGSQMPPPEEPLDAVLLGNAPDDVAFGVTARRSRLALAVVGPPHAGKSVLCYSINMLLRGARQGVWVFDATPDAEGHWYQGVADPAAADELKQKAKRSAPQADTETKTPWTEEYVRAVVDHVRALRDCGNLLVVGTGGKRTEATCRLAEQCQYALILLRTDTPPDDEQQWLKLCQRANCTVLGIVRSDLEATETKVPVGPQGMLEGTVAELERQDPESIARSRPLVQALVRWIQQDLQEGIKIFEAMGRTVDCDQR